MHLHHSQRHRVLQARGAFLGVARRDDGEAHLGQADGGGLAEATVAARDDNGILQTEQQLTDRWLS